MANEISDITRHAIIDLFGASDTSWSGRLSDDDFLARLYDLAALPSTDHRYRNAAGDIHTHRVSFHDWDDDWVFYDSRFNLLYAEDDKFLRFLCETIHPAVRPDAQEVQKLALEYNQLLKADGWQLVVAKRISGRPVFASQKHGSRVEIFEEATGWQKVDRQLQEARSRLDEAGAEEQYQAVGLLCRETLISVAQAVFDAARHPVERDTSDTDVKRLLDAIFDAELKGTGNEEARAHGKAAVRLALALQHKRTADFKTAALCAEATCSVVNLLAVLAGRRGRSFA